MDSEIILNDNKRPTVKITDPSGRALTLTGRGSSETYVGVSFEDEKENVNDWHIDTERLYDILWEEFKKE